jgi:hypothetical protein
MKRKLISILSIVLLVFGITGGASAGLIIVSGDQTPAYYSVSGDNQIFFKNILQDGKSVVVHDLSMASSVHFYYDSLPGVSSTQMGDTVVTADTFAGVDLFITGLDSGGFSGSELAAFGDYIGSGGSVLFMCDYVFPVTPINSALSYIGSGMSLYEPPNDTGTLTAIGGQITPDPLNAGVASFVYGYTYGVSGGIPLLLDRSRRPFISYETAVPIPAAVFLFGSGLVALFNLRIRRYHRV